MLLSSLILFFLRLIVDDDQCDAQTEGDDNQNNNWSLVFHKNRMRPLPLIWQAPMSTLINRRRSLHYCSWIFRMRSQS